jgi:hypothetical protein
MVAGPGILFTYWALCHAAMMRISFIALNNYLTLKASNHSRTDRFSTRLFMPIITCLTFEHSVANIAVNPGLNGTVGKTTTLTGIRA